MNLKVVLDSPYGEFRTTIADQPLVIKNGATGILRSGWVCFGSEARLRIPGHWLKPAPQEHQEGESK